MTKNSTADVKVYISTNGCEEAQLSSKSLEKFVEMNKLKQTKNAKEADFIIFYACGLTQYTENKSLRIIKNLKKMNPSSKLIVWGCLSKQNPESLAKVYDGPIIGPLDRNVFKEILGKTSISFDDIELSAPDSALKNCMETSWIIDYENNNPLTNLISLSKQCYNKLWYKTQKRSKVYYIRVASGCTGNCTYCSEHPVYGGIKSRLIDDVVSEFKLGLQQGYNQFSLLATDLGAYGRDKNFTLCDLLRKIIETNSNTNYTLILNQVEPSNLIKIYLDLEEILASGKVEGLMCPVQSGSNRILKLMGRKYTVEEWKNYMLKINGKFPDIRLSTHFLIGFPTETEEDFNETKILLDPPPFFNDITVFKYSERPMVASRHLPGQVSEETKELRRKELLTKFAHAQTPANVKRKRTGSRDGFATDSSGV
jgi:MiaB/RimO family radical SAM methylthiotransferase